MQDVLGGMLLHLASQAEVAVLKDAQMKIRLTAQQYGAVRKMAD